MGNINYTKSLFKKKICLFFGWVLAGNMHRYLYWRSLAIADKKKKIHLNPFFFLSFKRTCFHYAYAIVERRSKNAKKKKKECRSHKPGNDYTKMLNTTVNYDKSSMCKKIKRKEWNSMQHLPLLVSTPCMQTEVAKYSLWIFYENTYSFT